MQFDLSFNSSVLNAWTTTPLSLAGLLSVQVDTPEAVVDPVPGFLQFSISSYISNARSRDVISVFFQL